MIKFSPSILAADFAALGRDIRAVEQAGADYLHFDVMDGHFVPNISFGLPVLRSVRACTALPLDVHLMISEPDRYLEAFIGAGADIVTVHLESAAIRARRCAGFGSWRAAVRFHQTCDAAFGRSAAFAGA